MNKTMNSLEATRDRQPLRTFFNDFERQQKSFLVRDFSHASWLKYQSRGCKQKHYFKRIAVDVNDRVVGRPSIGSQINIPTSYNTVLPKPNT